MIEQTSKREVSETAWPFNDVLKKLIEAAEYLLHKKDYDGHDHEEIAICVQRGKEILSDNDREGWIDVEKNAKQFWLWCFMYGHKVTGYYSIDERIEMMYDAYTKSLTT